MKFRTRDEEIFDEVLEEVVTDIEIAAVYVIRKKLSKYHFLMVLAYIFTFGRVKLFWNSPVEVIKSYFSNWFDSIKRAATDINKERNRFIGMEPDKMYDQLFDLIYAISLLPNNYNLSELIDSRD